MSNKSLKGALIIREDENGKKTITPNPRAANAVTHKIIDVCEGEDYLVAVTALVSVLCTLAEAGLVNLVKPQVSREQDRSRTARALRLNRSTVSRNLKRGHYWQLGEVVAAMKDYFREEWSQLHVHVQ